MARKREKEKYRKNETMQKRDRNNESKLENQTVQKRARKIYTEMKQTDIVSKKDVYKAAERNRYTKL